MAGEVITMDLNVDPPTLTVETPEGDLVYSPPRLFVPECRQRWFLISKPENCSATRCIVIRPGVADETPVIGTTWEWTAGGWQPIEINCVAGDPPVPAPGTSPPIPNPLPEIGHTEFIPCA